MSYRTDLDTLLPSFNTQPYSYNIPPPIFTKNTLPSIRDLMPMIYQEMLPKDCSEDAPQAFRNITCLAKTEPSPMMKTLHATQNVAFTIPDSSSASLSESQAAAIASPLRSPASCDGQSVRRSQRTKKLSKRIDPSIYTTAQQRVNSEKRKWSDLSQCYGEQTPPKQDVGTSIQSQAPKKRKRQSQWIDFSHYHSSGLGSNQNSVKQKHMLIRTHAFDFSEFVDAKTYKEKQ
jgi:hypothetical protein